MPQRSPRPAARLTVEPLEDRLCPSLTEPFDTTPAGSLPAGWVQWGKTGEQPFAVSAAQTVAAPVSPANVLAATTNYSQLDARAWHAAGQPADVQVSTSVFLNL